MRISAKWIRENYIKYNEILFGGKLPTNIEFKLGRMKNSVGAAGYIVDCKTGTITPKYIKISGMYDNVEDAHLSTLLHEMIHIEDYVFHPEHFFSEETDYNGHTIYRRKEYDAHGEWFLSECDRINSKNIIKFKLSPKQTDEETKTETALFNTSLIICLLNIKTDDISKAWRVIKTNINGMKKEKEWIGKDFEYFKKRIVGIEWYVVDADSRFSTFPNKCGFDNHIFSISDTEKEKFVKDNNLKFIEKIVLDENYQRPKISDEKYASKLDIDLQICIDRIKKNPDFKKNGIGTCNIKDSVSDVTMQVSVNKKNDILQVLFNGNNPLVFSYKKYLQDLKGFYFEKKYGEAILKHMRNNNVIQENKIMTYKTIIREVIDQYVTKNQTNDDVTVYGLAGRRRFERNLGNGKIIGEIE